MKKTITLPCSAGDILYVVDWGKVISMIVVKIECIIDVAKDYYVISANSSSGYTEYYLAKDINSKCFFSQEEAEQKLKEKIHEHSNN